MPDLKKSLGYTYLQQTKFSPEGLQNQLRPHIAPAAEYKQYPDAEIITLPRDFFPGDVNLWDLLQKRRSCRKFGNQECTIKELALLLWAGQGLTAQAGSYFFRTAPSAGALYPIETYLAIQGIDDIPPGLYHFDVKGFQLEQLIPEPIGKQLSQACLNQNFIAQAPVVFIWTTILRRNMSKYGHRGMRYICLDAGHICQNVILAAEAIGFGACPVAAFFDDEVNDILDLDGEEESTLYLAPVGPRT